MADRTTAIALKNTDTLHKMLDDPPENVLLSKSPDDATASSLNPESLSSQTFDFSNHAVFQIL